MSLRTVLASAIDPDRWETTVVADPAEVELLVNRLASPAVSDAQIEHLGRPAYVDEDGESGPDHLVYAGVHDGRGYLDYIGARFGGDLPAVGILDGDPDSPEWQGAGHAFHRSSGVTLDSFHRLLVDLLRSGRPSERARWLDGEVHPTAPPAYHPAAGDR
ncbi:hypothetical protein FHR81_000812 [Actinoalloteichus hoggarensis]|uniref:Uncharacterized protein n=1 Tax=Actinoalloteichus hoggarensis TaxID=1470176 RepID=A0A221W1T3_9PSEU|nr:Imm1 family immunity protein [Actinoalloteichus hoggarensis]ASO19511.1 hypothetical protein AHOG_09335 [Actinoalloteichus hoggarensis]MBB5919783.1 hypothetical protein [Actinoalloteichus hoggarensis]